MVTKDILNIASKEMKFTLNEDEFNAFLEEFVLIQKQFELLANVKGVDEYEPIIEPFNLDSFNNDFESSKLIDYKCDSSLIMELHQALLNGDITPLELVKSAIEKAKKDDNNAFEYICEEEALTAVKQLDPFKKNNLLWGIPYALKDNFYTEGIPTKASSNLLDGYIPNFDSEVCRLLKEQGAILIGKTTMDELAMGGQGSSGHLGRTFNPWDISHEHIIGGSSSGSAAACASGIVPFAIGSDTGDSARKPASYSNLVGFKPTWGNISNKGLIPFAPSLDTVGFFTRNVIDSEIVLSTLTNKLVKNDVKCLKIAIIDEIYDSMTNTTIKKAFEKVVSELEKQGVIFDHVHLDINICRAIVPAYSILSNSEGTLSNLSLDEITSKNRTESLSRLTKKRLIIGRFALMEENYNELYLRAQKYRHLINDKINDILKQYNAIYLPSSMNSAPRFEEEFDRLSDEFLIGDNYLAIANFGGLPSITIPLGFENELPFGGNLIGRIFDEGTLLVIGKKIEDIVGLTNLLPETHK